MFRLAHISDVHLGPLPKFARRELASKRITGYINWRRKRSSSMNDGVLDRLLSSLKSQQPNHIAITGDLVNLALKEEIELMRGWLESVGPADDVSIVPGNHDTYVPGALKDIVAAWRPYLTGDHDDGGHPFPYLRERANIAMIGVNSGRASMPFMATGSFRSKQAEQTKALLETAGAEEKFRIVFIHHPPFVKATHWHKRLVGSDRFRKTLAQCGAELILHGHTHIESLEYIDGPHGKIPVVGVPSASHAPPPVGSDSHKQGARYNLFDIAGQAGSWTCRMQEFGYENGSSSVTQIADRMLIS
jgi:3',5'-cyclic AMP phosphodiesterase CpdA